MKLLQIIDNKKKTYYFAEVTPNVVTGEMEICTDSTYKDERGLIERGYTNLGKSLEMLRQMGKLTELN